MEILFPNKTGIQDVNMSISIKVRIQKNMNDLTERYDDDGEESDKHLHRSNIWNEFLSS